MRGVIDGNSQIAPDPGPLVKFVRPGPELEIDGAVTIAREESLRRRTLQNVRVLAGHALKYADHLFWLGTVVDAHFQVDAAQAVAKGPVGHLFTDEVSIGHDDVGALPRAHDAGTYTDAPYLTQQVSYLDRVAHVDWPLKEQDQP